MKGGNNMKINNKTMLLIVVMFLYLFQTDYSCAADSYEVNIDVPIEISQLKATRLAPTLDAEIKTGENLIYCESYQAAWNKMCKDVLNGETPEIEGSPDFVKTLNENIDKPVDLPEDSYVAMAGLEKDGVTDKFNKEFKRKFGYASNIKSTCETESLNVLSSYNKKIKFENEKGIFITPLYYCLNMDSEPIEILDLLFDRFTFDTNNVTLGKKAYILYSSPFLMKNKCCRPIFGSIIRLLTLPEDEEIILSSIPPGKTLKETYIKINDFRKGDFKNYINLKSLDEVSLKIVNSMAESKKYNYLKEFDVDARYIMPVLKINLFMKNPEINLKSIKSDNIKIYSNQHIKIDFDINCEITESDKLALGPLGIYGIQLSWGLIRNPYVILIRKKTSEYPYFMAYIGNDEFFIKAKMK